MIAHKGLCLDDGVVTRKWLPWRYPGEALETPFGARVVVYALLRLVSFSCLKTPLRRTITAPSIIHHSQAYIAALHLSSMTMKDYPIEPRLKKLNDKLSAHITEGSNIEKPLINFVDQESLVHGSNITARVRRPESSSETVKGRDESVPSRRTRPQHSLRVVFLDKHNTTGIKSSFYPDIVDVGPSPPESDCATSSSSTARNDTTKKEQRNYEPASIEEVVHGRNR